mgnify:CR=1 FL=1
MPQTPRRSPEAGLGTRSQEDPWLRKMVRGVATVGQFFSSYVGYPAVRLQPGRLGDREVLLVFDPPESPAPAYFLWLAWEGGKIRFIRDYRYVRYVSEGAGLVLA